MQNFTPKKAGTNYIICNLKKLKLFFRDGQNFKMESSKVIIYWPDMY